MDIDKMKMNGKTLFMVIVAAMGLTSCIEDACVDMYTTSEIWLRNGTSEPLYYTFSDTPQLTPECTVWQMPLKLAYILDFKQFSPKQVMSAPTYTPNGHRGSGDLYGYYKYLLLLRYDNTVVACYDISRSALARADYPWFSPVADETEKRLDMVDVCHKPETTYVYTYYITDSIL